LNPTFHLNGERARPGRSSTRLASNTSRCAHPKWEKASGVAVRLADGASARTREARVFHMKQQVL